MPLASISRDALRNQNPGEHTTRGNIARQADKCVQLSAKNGGRSGGKEGHVYV